MTDSKPFGLRDVKVQNKLGTITEDLPNAQKLTFKTNFKSGRLQGDDVTKAVTSFPVDGDWELEAGGISLAAWAVMTGVTISSVGISPNVQSTYKVEAGIGMPYFKIFGKSLGDEDDDVHMILYKCKVLELEGEFSDGNFWVTKCKGAAIDDGTNGIYDVVTNETAEDLVETS